MRVWNEYPSRFDLLICCPLNRTGGVTGRDHSPEMQYTRRDSTPPPNTLKSQAIPHPVASAGADSGALAPADPLAAFVASLTPDQRAALVRLLVTPSPTG